MKYRHGYKIVREVGDELRSAIMTNSSRLYGIGRRTKRNKRNGPLAVFSNLRDARSWRYYPFKIYKCKYVLYTEEKQSLWRYSRGSLRSVSHEFLPFGTKLAEEVILMHEVDIYGTKI